MTTQPGKCKLFSYKFQVVTDRPIVGYSRPIPFALSEAIKSQIDKMVDDILEIGFSFFLNPLTIVQRDGKNTWYLCIYPYIKSVYHP
jgi:hypothetical protein